MLVSEANMGTWNDLSSELSQAVQSVGKSIVTIQAGGGRTLSGIILDEKTILTTARGIREDENIRAWVSPDQEIKAVLKGSDSETDIAILQIEDNLGTPATFLEQPALSVGQLVVAIGRTWRGNLVASAGILSGLMGEWHTFGGKKIEAFIRPDMNLYPGFSGGALIGADHKVIGMMSASLRRGSPLAIPHATIRRIGPVLREKGYIPKPYLGLGLQPVLIPESLQQKLNLTQNVGALVVQVEPNSPSEKAGFLLGDVLLRLGDHEFGHQGAAPVVFRLAPNQKVNISGTRGGQEFSSELVVGERPRRQI